MYLLVCQLDCKWYIILVIPIIYEHTLCFTVGIYQTLDSSYIKKKMIRIKENYVIEYSFTFNSAVSIVWVLNLI